MATQFPSDFAAVVRISTITVALKSQKIRVAGRLRNYEPAKSLICLDDEGISLLVDISLCLSGYASYPWLRERNSTVMAIGYLETLDQSQGEDLDTSCLILRALVMTERRGLDLDVWNSAIERLSEFKSKNRNDQQDDSHDTQQTKRYALNTRK